MNTLPPHLSLTPPVLVLTLCLFATPQSPGAALGMFEGQGDIGAVKHPGSVTLSGDGKVYTVSGSGENMWFTNDAFFFAWKKVSGDFRLSAALEWVGAGAHEHRKGCLLVRQTLDPDSPYVDIALHGDGLSSLQFREVKGGPTREVQFGRAQPKVAAIERQGTTFITLTGSSSADLAPAGSFMRLNFTDPVYVGLGVCSHNNDVLEQAKFRDVVLETGRSAAGAKGTLHSSLETVNIGSLDRRVVYTAPEHFEAPNWLPNGKDFIFNSKGRIYRVAAGEKPAVIDTGFANKCNNDHGLSPDGKQLVISDGSKNGRSQIYVLPITGGTPRLVTENSPSYWHGWSPDGKTLAYCAERNQEFDVYTIPVEGGAEKRLTTAPGLDDGPEYSPDGKYIYFNSVRSGLMQIWRMKPDGSDQEQVTKDDYNNWFAHPSPDGKWIVFLTYEKDVVGHPADKPVMLRMMPVAGGPVTVAARLFGGQGTINVPSWSPDSKNVAFVSYEYIR